MFRRLFLSFILAASLPLCCAGCSPLAPVVSGVASVITDAMAVLQIIDTAAQEYLRTHPNVPPEVSAKYAALYARAVSALNLANHSLAGVQDLDQNQVDAAFAEFKAAYLELRDFLSLRGMMSGGKMSSGGEEVVIPEPAALTYRLE